MLQIIRMVYQVLWEQMKRGHEIWGINSRMTCSPASVIDD